MKGPKIDEESCIGCKSCVEACPVSPPVIGFKNCKAFTEFPENCIHCTACAMICPVNAIDLEKREGETY